MSRSGLTHIDQQGAAQMVDVGDKPVTRRTAVAVATCVMQPATAVLIRDNTSKKGDVLQVARIAAINAAKRTDELIPLCHSVPLDQIKTSFDWPAEGKLLIQVTAISTGKTGVEMEALSAAAIAALTVYDMCKAVDRSMSIQDVQLLSKTGGARGDFLRQNKESPDA